MKTARHEMVMIGSKDRGTGVMRPEEAAALFDGMYDDRREAFMAVYLDTRHRPLAKPYVISVGSISASLVHPREVFRPAVEVGAAAMILAHNHPSGSPRPSGDDLELTARLDKAGDMMGIAVLDHLILGETGDGESDFTSIREYGWPTGESA